MGEYYQEWIARKVLPLVRKSRARDYRNSFRAYILPKFRHLKLTELTPAILETLRSYLLHDRELSLKTVRNVVDAHFRAMIRDARMVDGLIEKGPFAALQWPRMESSEPDPFMEGGARQDP